MHLLDTASIMVTDNIVSSLDILVKVLVPYITNIVYIKEIKK